MQENFLAVLELLDTRENCPSLVLNALLPETPIWLLSGSIHSDNLGWMKADPEKFKSHAPYFRI